MSQLMPLPLTVSCFSKIQIGFTFLVPAHLGSPEKGPLNGCVYCTTTKLLQCFIPLEMHVSLICAIKFYLLTYLLTVNNTCLSSQTTCIRLCCCYYKNQLAESYKMHKLLRTPLSVEATTTTVAYAFSYIDLTHCTRLYRQRN